MVPTSCQLSQAHWEPVWHRWRFPPNGLEAWTDRLQSSELTQLVGAGAAAAGAERGAPLPAHTTGPGTSAQMPLAFCILTQKGDPGHCPVHSGDPGRVRRAGGRPPEDDTRGTDGGLGKRPHSSVVFLFFLFL